MLAGSLTVSMSKSSHTRRSFKNKHPKATPPEVCNTVQGIGTPQTKCPLRSPNLPQIGIANEVAQFFGLNKFRLGRILWRRHREKLPSSCLLLGAAPSGSGAANGAAGAAEEDGASEGRGSGAGAVPTAEIRPRQSPGAAPAAKPAGAAPGNQQMQRPEAGERQAARRRQIRLKTTAWTMARPAIRRCSPFG